jgi:thiol-disulfide isomerase/thioredoxin
MKKILLITGSVFIGAFAFTQGIKKVRITDLEKIIRESKTPLIVNFWATFCIPCLEEIPYFQKSVKKHQKDSLQLLLISLDLKGDYPGIRAFAAKRKITARIVWLNETDADYFCPKIDSAWSGALPATVFINNKTGYRKLCEEQIKEDNLEKEIMATLRKKY